MLAYNDWGGANRYRGLGDDPREDAGSPLSSTRRPIARGMIRKPAGVPREANHLTLPMNGAPRYASYEWARLNGYSRHHADAFWAIYERPFVQWAERHGYEQAERRSDDAVLLPAARARPGRRPVTADGHHGLGGQVGGAPGGHHDRPERPRRHLQPDYVHEGEMRGAGMIAAFTRGRGEVFNGGSTEWAHALGVGDPFVDRIVRNALDRFLTREIGAPHEHQ
jgi:hypothetical protein